MVIQALPRSAVRAIGAGQVLPDPAAVVKELVENALDAHATSISVRISANTLDSIQVRDNGHGIAPGDRAMMARRYCTSKIADENDIQTIGASSLGFRGEALASAAELSGSLSIATRIEGEQTATVSTISQQGQVAAVEHTTLPVGTTIHITEFLQTHPVRRQLALKNPEKRIKNIKQTLQSYAFARYNVRLSLRILKSNSNRDDFLFAPKPGGNAQDAALQLVGAACISQCLWSEVSENGFFFRGLLPRPDAESRKINGLGSFISVDARPMSNSKGIAKQICKLHRDTLKQWHVPIGDVKDSFMHLQISCPTGSYDVNIEPAKDDVLFEDPEVIIGITQKWFSTIYGPQKDQAGSADSHPSHLNEPSGQNLPRNSSSLITAVTSTAPEQDSMPLSTSQEMSSMAGRSAIYHNSLLIPSKLGFHQDSFQSHNHHIDTDEQLSETEEFQALRTNVQLSNPWTLAKMHTSQKSLTSDATKVYATPAASDDRAFLSSSPNHVQVDQLGTLAGYLLTPMASSPVPRYRPHVGNQILPNPDIVSESHLDVEPSLSAPPSGQKSPVAPQSQDNGRLMHHPPSDGKHSNSLLPFPLNDVELRAGTTSTEISDMSLQSHCNPNKKRNRRGVNKPFTVPTKRDDSKGKIWFDHLNEVEGTQRETRAKRQKLPYPANGLVIQGEQVIDGDPRTQSPPSNNRDIRDFVNASQYRDAGLVQEHPEYRVPACRKRKTYRGTRMDKISVMAAARDGRKGTVCAPPGHVAGIMASPGLPPTLACQRFNSGPEIEERSSLEPGVNGGLPRRASRPRQETHQTVGHGSAPMRRRSSIRSHRTEILNDPLEHTPAGCGTQNVVQMLHYSILDFARLVDGMDTDNCSIHFSEPAIKQFHTFAAGTTDSNVLSHRVHALLVQAGVDTSRRADLEKLCLELERAFQQHAALGREGDDMLDS